MIVPCWCLLSVVGCSLCVVSVLLFVLSTFVVCRLRVVVRCLLLFVVVRSWLLYVVRYVSFS